MRQLTPADKTACLVEATARMEEFFRLAQEELTDEASPRPSAVDRAAELLSRPDVSDDMTAAIHVEHLQALREKRRTPRISAELEATSRDVVYS